MVIYLLKKLKKKKKLPILLTGSLHVAMWGCRCEEIVTIGELFLL